ncbi:sugar phosphate isomerase/epimerase family protein [Pseudochelatococcus sp. B33]
MTKSAMLSLAHLTVLDATPPELIEAAAAAGFDAVGLRIVPPLPTDRIVPVVGRPEAIREIAGALAATGIRIFDVEAVWLMPHTDVAALRPALEVGARLGARHLLVVGNDPEPARLRDNFAQLCAEAAGFGLGVALEPMSYVEVNTLARAAALRQAGGANATLLIDALHLFRSGGTPAEVAAMDPGLFAYLHLCDAAAQPPEPGNLRAEGRGGRFYPGEGELPLKAFLDAFPPDIPIAVEAPCARHDDRPVAERAELCGRATRRLLAEAGRL